MKRGKIRLSINLFFVFLLMTIYMIGCGKDEIVNTSDQQQGINETIQWNVSHSPMPGQFEVSTIDNDKIYACRFEEGSMTISVFTIDTVEQTACYSIPGMIELKSISINASNEICLLGSTENSETLWKVSPNGNISTIENINVEELGELPLLKDFYADSNGFYYLWYEMSVPCSEVYEDGEEDIYTKLDRIYVKDQEMNTIIYEEVPDSYHNKLLSLAFDENDIPMLLAEDEDGYYVQRIRTTDSEKYKPCRLTNELNDLENSNIIAYTQDGLLYTKEGSLHLYHMSDSQDEKLLELASAGVLEEDIIYLGMRGSTIEIIDNYKGLQQSEYTTVERGENQKTQLTLGVMTLQPEMMETIASFNRYQNEVTIEPIVYVDNYDYDTGYEKLTLDIIQGKAPDLISVYGLGYESLTKAGAFTDLYMFMQQDAELKAENFISSVLNVYEQEGHLYTIAPTFRIYTMWGAGSMVEGRNGINVEEMIQLLHDNGGDINSIYGFSADEDVLTTLCSFNMDKFINWNEGTCDFTGKEFQQIINFTKEYEGKSYESLYKAVQNGDILLTLGLITSVEDYRLESELYGENVQFIGYPTEMGTGSAVLFSGDEMAINSKSKYQEEAWDFIKFFIQNGYKGTGFPIVKEQFDKILDESLNEVIINEDGEMCKVAKKNYHEKDVISIQVFKCEPEDIEIIRELVDHVSDKFQYNTEIQKIINEEVSAYLHNQKNIEEVCSIIQNRVHLYLNER